MHECEGKRLPAVKVILHQLDWLMHNDFYLKKKVDVGNMAENFILYFSPNVDIYIVIIGYRNIRSHGEYRMGNNVIHQVDPSGILVNVKIVPI